MELTTSDLRIGNWIKYLLKGTPHYSKVDAGDLSWLSENLKEFNDYHFGIEITEDILIKCGFEKDRDLNIFSYKGFYIDINNFNVYGEYERIATVKYLHELQNLFYCLTKEELKIEL